MKNKKYPMSWPIFAFLTFILMNVFPPFAFILIAYQFGAFKTKKQKTAQNDSAREARFEKYLIMTAGREVESISYLADAVGVSYETALRDLQTMVSEGRFGAKGYINYVDRTIVLAERGARSQPVTPPRAQAVPRESAGVTKKEAAKETKKRASKSRVKNKDKLYGAWPVWLIIIGIVALVAGVSITAEAIDMISWWGFDASVVAEFFRGFVWTTAGAASLIVRGNMKKRENRVKVYSAALMGCDCISIDELRKRTGVKDKTLRRDLEFMLEKGLLGKEAYIDHGHGLLVLKTGAVPKKKEEEAPKEAPKDDEDRYTAILREIRQVNDDIPDEEISAKIDEMEDLTAAIFKAVQEKPEKLPQIKSFMSYYLPTALKLLRSYADFDQAGAAGSNITTAKADIERILGTLVEGFRKQLDKLYEADAMDVSADINVLENMLRRDGLSGTDNPFGTGGTGATMN